MRELYENRVVHVCLMQLVSDKCSSKNTSRDMIFDMLLYRMLMISKSAVEACMMDRRMG